MLALTGSPAKAGVVGFAKTMPIAVAAGSVPYALIVVLAKRHGASSALVGVMLGIAAAGGLLGALLAPMLQRRLSARLVLIGETCVIALSLIAFSAGWLGPLGVGFMLQNAGSTATILTLAAWALSLAIVAIVTPAFRQPPKLTYDPPRCSLRTDTQTTEEAPHDR